MLSAHVRRTLFSSLLVLALVSSAHAQSAPSTEPAAALIREGRALLSQGQAQEALARFSRAYELGRFATARAHMGVAEGALGHPVEAERFLREALEAPTDALMQPAWVERFRENLRVAQRSVGQFTARGNVEGARVFLNGREVGALPFAAPIRVRAETVRMRVTAEGYYALERDVIIGGELAITTENIELNRVAIEPAHTTSNASDGRTAPTRVLDGGERTAVRPVVAPVVGSAPPTVVIVHRESNVGRAQSSGPSGALVGAAVATGVLGLLGIGAGAVAVGIAGYNNGEIVAADCAHRTGVVECTTARQNVAIAEGVQLGGFVGGGIFVASSIALSVAAARSAAAPRPSGARSWVCAPGAASVTCTGRF
jgi:hypothetical protein